MGWTCVASRKSTTGFPVGTTVSGSAEAEGSFPERVLELAEECGDGSSGKG